MTSVIVIIYTIIAAVFAFVATLLQPAAIYFLFQIFSPDNGDSYYVMPVFLLIWLILMSPLLIYMTIAKILRMIKTEVVSPDRTGIFVTRLKAFQSSMAGIAIYVDGKKAGIVDNNRTKFIDIPAGIHTIKAGSGRQSSEVLELSIFNGQQPCFEMEIIGMGMLYKYELRQITKEREI
jgi:hypothetical protein